MADEKKTMTRRDLFRAVTGRGGGDDAEERDPALEESEKEADPAFAEGAAAYGRRDWETAVERLRPYVRANQSDAEARKLLGGALYAQGRHIQAKVEFAGVLRRSPGDVFASLGLCLAQLRLDRPDKAAEALAGLEDSEEAAVLRTRAAPLLSGEGVDASQLADALERSPGLGTRASA